jgi:hypothetical protein
VDRLVVCRVQGDFTMCALDARLSKDRQKMKGSCSVSPDRRDHPVVEVFFLVNFLLVSI